MLHGMAKVDNPGWALPNQVSPLKAENSLWLTIDEEIKETCSI